jgi:hypothetical protein
MSTDEAKQWVRQIRQAHNTLLGQSDRKSVNGFVAHHEEALQERFESHYRPLAKAAYSGQNQPELQGFALSLLRTGARLKPELIPSLMKAANDESGTLDYDDIGNIESLITYAIVEELRKGLSQFVEYGLSQTVYLQPLLATPQAVNRLLANNVYSGVLANRSYGGCPGNHNPGADGFDLDALYGVHQEAFGGRGNKSKEELSWHGGSTHDGTCVNCNEKKKVGVKNWCKDCIHCDSE